MLSYAHTNSIEAFLEPAVELCATLLERDAQEVQARVPGAGATVALVANVQSFVMFSAGGDSPISFAAARCAVLLSEVRSHH